MSVATTNQYIAYLVRLWREGPGVWRGMLEDVSSGERIYFKDVEELLAYLCDRAIEKDGESSSVIGNQ